MPAPPQAFLERLEAAGLGLWATLPAGEYDAVVPAPWRSAGVLPGARTAILLGSGGRGLWEAFRRAPEWGRPGDPLDAYTERIAAEAAAALEAAGHPSLALFAHQPRGGQLADFVGLGARAGLGAPSRLGLLLHPHHGPWLSLRALLLSELDWSAPAQAPEGFDPCRGCSAPCQRACPGAAPTPAGFDLGRCAAARGHTPACAESCAARLACVVGPASAYAPEALAHHMRHVRLP